MYCSLSEPGHGCGIAAFNNKIPSMAGTKFYIKFMVSLRCKMVVQQELDLLGLKHGAIDLGVVEILDNVTEEQRLLLKGNLLKSGLELLDDKRSILIEKIKNVITEMIHYSDEVPNTNYSNLISEKLGYDYTYLSNIFSEVKGITIQQFIIINKIERVKELLLYDELNLTEISYKLHYSSVAHLSNQFKKVTGLSPSFFKQLKRKRKGNLEDL
jgi:AraC-like DNA-binding protein